MRLEIDTKKDSVDDIKKMIEFLSKFVSDNSYGDNPSPPDVGSGSFNMFSDDNNPSVPYSDDSKDDEDDNDSKISIVEY